jgi:phosphoribosyl-ATP pyrophosphohydrolase/phosphoribosyl-AMP cyclohydrolase
MELKLDKQGLIPAIAQDARTGENLMLGYMNPGTIKRTIEGAQVWFYGRSMEDLWHKGEVTGNYLNVQDAWIDCDNDTILLRVIPDGPACHTGNTSCFFTPLDVIPEAEDFLKTEPGSQILDEIFTVIQDGKANLPDGSYTAELLKEGVGRVAQKVTEKVREADTAVTQDSNELPSEIARLFYHALALMSSTGVKPQQVWDELKAWKDEKRIF